MADNMVFCNETLEQDILQFEQKCKDAFFQAMPALAQDIIDTLSSHIQTDVYDAYTPKSYKRRKDNPNLGTSISDIKGSGMGSYGRDNVTITYIPDGSHPQWESPASGDDLIRRIESGSGYEWRKHPGARPFFKNTTEELFDEGRAEQFFIQAVNAAEPNLGIDYGDDFDIIRDSNDWNG